MDLYRQNSATGRRTFGAYSLFTILLIAATVNGSQQQPSVTQEAISVNYVIVPFVPLDSQRRPILNLQQRDVRLLVDGEPVAYDMFERGADAPVSFTILLDVSGSMSLAGKMAGARTAIYSLLRGSAKGDDFSLWAFADGGVEEIVPFTSDPDKILIALWKLEPFGKTAFRDALALMPDKSILGSNGSRAIILLTDALDNASVVSREELAAILESVDVPIYPLGLRPREVKTGAPASPDHLTDLELLQEIARTSGGRALVSSDLAELERGIKQMLSDLRSQYFVGFKPTGKGPVRFRRILVRIAGRNRSARVRAGYRGTEPPKIPSNERAKERL